MPDQTQNPAADAGQGDTAQPNDTSTQVSQPEAPEVIETQAPETQTNPDDGETADKGEPAKNKGGRPPKKVAVVTEAKATASAALIKFLSRVPHQIIDLGDQRVEFEMGVANVTEDVANRLRGHHLFSHNHIYDGRDTIRLGNDFVEISKESPAVQDALRHPDKDTTIFVFTENPNVEINMGDTSVRFHMGKAVVKDTALAARLERHMFFAQGRMTKLVF